MNIANCTKKFISSEATTESGMQSRGKYTFPNRLRFSTNVFDVLVRQLEKKCHVMLPAI